MGIASLNPSYIYFISDTRASSVPFDHIPLDFNHLIQRQEGWIHWLVGEAFEHPAVLTVSLLECSTEAFLPVWISNGRDNEAFSICGNREGSLSINIKEI